MLNLNNSESLYILDYFISNRNYSKESRWDLSQLVSIVTLDTAEDDAKVQEVIAESSKGNYMGAGALIGGVVDSLLGEGDSILDGVIVGALFGSLINKEKRAKEPVANITLVFRDGVILPLEVNKSEYVTLQNVIIEANSNTIKIKGSLPSYEILYRERELDVCRSNRFISTIKWMVLSAVVMLVVYVFTNHFVEVDLMLIDVIRYISFLGFCFLFLSLITQIVDNVLSGGPYMWSEKQFTKDEYENLTNKHNMSENIL
jgi:outer membrane lipoprotein SlyB